jgi:hypothetical protein
VSPADEAMKIFFLFFNECSRTEWLPLLSYQNIYLPLLIMTTRIEVFTPIAGGTEGKKKRRKRKSEVFFY